MRSPADEYAERLSAREAKVSAFTKVQAQVGYGRLLLATVTLVAAGYSFRAHAFSPYWLWVPIAGFIGLVAYHFRVRRDSSAAQRAAAFFRAGLLRIEDRWAGTGQQGTQFADPHHVYAADLDLFGKGSLFELLCTARTRMGEDTLARWLLSPAGVQEIRERHAALADLKGRLDFREQLAVQGENLHAGVHPQALLKWAEALNRLQAPWIRWVATILSVLAVGTAIFWSATGVGSPFILVLMVEVAVLYALRGRVDDVLHGTESAFEDLRLFTALLTRIEREGFHAAPLQALVRRLSSHALPASRTIGRLATIVNFAGSRRNQIVAVVAVPLMYTLHVALAAERWRRLYGSVVRSWIEVMGEFEAHLCLAAYSYEHPDDPFPQFVQGPALFQATALGHPLISAARRVNNDVNIAGQTRVLLISGSNMSGKSTLLRTVGINTVLAMAGAPVKAAQLQLTPLQIGASIRINDSLHEGSSRFYAEITRLRQLFDLTGRNPDLLFLLDELLQGTNSRDRHLGAAGVVRALLARGAAGLISTHDLALTDILGPEDHSLRNMHFQDELDNGRMTFDFKLRDGIVTKSNAVELMRSIGLEV